MTSMPSRWSAASLRSFAEQGGTAVFLEQPAGAVWHFGESDVAVKEMTGREFVSRKTGHPLVAAFQPFDFSYWYDAEKDYIEYVATSYLEGGDLIPILQTTDRGEGRIRSRPRAYGPAGVSGTARGQGFVRHFPVEGNRTRLLRTHCRRILPGDD